MPAASDPAVSELDKAATLVGSSPSDTFHSRSDSTGKQSALSGFPWITHNRRNGSTFSQALNAQAELFSNDSDAPPLEVGWPRLAQEMARSVELESFCRFRELNVKNLLYYQVEIAEMEADLRKAEREDWEKHRHGKWEGTYAREAHMMLKAKDEKDATPEEKRQCKLVLDIRERLREYNAALLQHGQVSAMPQPNAHNVETLRVWIKRNGCGVDAIGGKSASAWGDHKNPEKDFIPPSRRILPVFRELVWPQKPPPKDLNLVRTQPGQELDTFTRWVEQEFMPLWHDVCYSKKIAGMDDPDYNTAKRYSQSKMLKFTSFVATVLACALPTVAIDILTTAKTKRDKLLYIGGFTMLFAIGLLLVSEAGTSRIQIFTATAAFSAVLVVFVQNQ